MPDRYLKDFEEFWKAFPRRVGKLAAEKAYRKARKHATALDLLNGIERYLEIKPAYADYCHPATWLNQGRWLDEGPQRVKASACGHEPQCASRHACIARTIDDGRKARAS